MATSATIELLLAFFDGALVQAVLALEERIHGSRIQAALLQRLLCGLLR